MWWFIIGNERGLPRIYTVKEGFLSIQNSGNNIQHKIWGKVWDTFCIPKINVFFWLLTKYKLLTIEYLKKRGFHGPSRCHLCQENDESAQHMFLECSFSKHVWKFFLGKIGQNLIFLGSISIMMSSWKGCYLGKIRTKKTLEEYGSRIWKMCAGKYGLQGTDLYLMIKKQTLNELPSKLQIC